MPQIDRPPIRIKRIARIAFNGSVLPFRAAHDVIISIANDIGFDASPIVFAVPGGSCRHRLAFSSSLDGFEQFP